MKKTTIFYFSGTGNTKWVTDKIAENLKSADNEVKAISIESINKSDVEDYIKYSEVMGLGYPIYGSDLPEPMKDFIDALPKQKKPISVFVFCTQMMFSGDGAFVYKKNLMLKGYTISHTAHINMHNNISITPFPLRILPKKKHEQVIKKAARKIARFSKAIVSNKKFFNGKYGYLLGIIQRGPYRAAYSKMQNLLKTDKDRCIKCNRCIRLCPVGNISLKDEYPDFQVKCVLCILL